MKLYQEIATAVNALENCKKSDNAEWIIKWSDRLAQFEELLPSGSGFDNGTKIDLDRTTANKIVLTTAYHHMDESGGYDGWTEHTLVVWPSFTSGFELYISGRDKNGFKEYAYECFSHALNALVTVSADNTVTIHEDSN